MAVVEEAVAVMAMASWAAAAGSAQSILEVGGASGCDDINGVEGHGQGLLLGPSRWGLVLPRLEKTEI